MLKIVQTCEVVQTCTRAQHVSGGKEDRKAMAKGEARFKDGLFHECSLRVKGYMPKLGAWIPGKGRNTLHRVRELRKGEYLGER